MFPPVISVLIVLATLALVGFGMLLVIVGRIQGQAFLPRVGVRLAGAAASLYAVAWLVGLLGTRSQLLAPGQEVSFCGLDCHLHVSVVAAERDRDLGVRVRFRSDAKQALEYPGLLRIAVVDEAGRTFAPTAGFAAEPLPAGETMDREFRFMLPADATAPRLVVSYDGWLDYLLPGRGNPLVQRRLALDLGIGGGGQWRSN
jgi:hypothetical protein